LLVLVGAEIGSSKIENESLFSVAAFFFPFVGGFVSVPNKLLLSKMLSEDCDVATGMSSKRALDNDFVSAVFTATATATGTGVGAGADTGAGAEIGAEAIVAEVEMGLEIEGAGAGISSPNIDLAVGLEEVGKSSNIECTADDTDGAGLSTDTFAASVAFFFSFVDFVAADFVLVGVVTSSMSPKMDAAVVDALLALGFFASALGVSSSKMEGALTLVALSLVFLVAVFLVVVVLEVLDFFVVALADCSTTA